MTDTVRFKGEYRFEGFDKEGNKVYDKTFKNLLVQNYYSAIFSVLNGGSTLFPVTHMATGTGATAPVVNNTALENEVFRKSISAKSYTANKFTTKLSIAASESVATIREIGVFANGTDTKGSGTLLSRCLVNIEKNASTQFLITYTITVE